MDVSVPSNPQSAIPNPQLANALAKSHLTCSPHDSTPYCLIQDGGELKPTAVNRLVICRVGRSPKQSITARSDGQSRRSYSASPKACRASVLLPQPDGPTIRPICHGSSRPGNSAAKCAVAFSASGTSNMPATCWTRKESWIGQKTVRLIVGIGSFLGFCGMVGGQLSVVSSVDDN